MTIASLPMYDLEPMRAATDAWWAGLAAAFRRQGLADVPDGLDRDGSFGDRFDHWASPALLLSQTCGYPLTHGFADSLRLVATPCYDAPHCSGPNYCSTVMVRADSEVASVEELRGGRVAVNGFDSQSGFNALRALVAPQARGGRFFGEVIETGRHHLSMQMVARGEADTCAVDCVSLALWQREMPEVVAGLRVLALTPQAPSLPYVTHIGRSDDEVRRLQTGLLEAAADPALAEVRARLLIGGFALLPRSAYDRIDEMEQEAARLGYPELA